jgi:hypothetical protein
MFHVEPLVSLWLVPHEPWSDPSRCTRHTPLPFARTSRLLPVKPHLRTTEVAVERAAATAPIHTVDLVARLGQRDLAVGRVPGAADLELAGDRHARLGERRDGDERGDGESEHEAFKRLTRPDVLRAKFSSYRVSLRYSLMWRIAERESPA